MNDLIGLEYEWGAKPSDGNGKTDCFQLVCEVRTRLGLTPYEGTFQWAYDCYTADTLKGFRIARWLLEVGKRLTMPRHGAVVLLAKTDNPALGTVVNQRVICISAGGRVISLPVNRVLAHYFWVD